MRSKALGNGVAPRCAYEAAGLAGRFRFHSLESAAFPLNGQGGGSQRRADGNACRLCCAVPMLAAAPPAETT